MILIDTHYFSAPATAGAFYFRKIYERLRARLYEYRISTPSVKPATPQEGNFRTKSFFPNISLKEIIGGTKGLRIT
jgi:hypothetical protein